MARILAEGTNENFSLPTYLSTDQSANKEGIAVGLHLSRVAAPVIFLVNISVVFLPFVSVGDSLFADIYYTVYGWADSWSTKFLLKIVRIMEHIAE